MFSFLTKKELGQIKHLQDNEERLKLYIDNLYVQLKTLEDYLDIRYFHGDKCKAHYRKRKTIKSPVGRPKKK